MKRLMRKYCLLTAVVFLFAFMPRAVWAQDNSALVTTAAQEPATRSNLTVETDLVLPDISANEPQQTTAALPQLESDSPADIVETPDAQLETQAASGDYLYEAVSGGVSITKYNGKEHEVTIPDTLDGKPVVKIGSSAFTSLSYASSVIVGKNVKTIGSKAFSWGYVSKVTIPATTTEIATDAFMTYSTVIIIGSKGSVAESVANTLENGRFLNMDMMENDFYYEEVAGGVKITYYGGSESPVIIPDTLGGKPVVAIGSGAVYHYKIIVGKNVKTIESNAFSSSVKELTIPATTTEIAPDAIPDDQYIRFSITNVYGSKGSAAESFARGLDNARFLIQGNVENNFWYEAIAGGIKITYYDGSESSVIIPDTLAGQSVVAIGSEAFTYINSANIIVGKNVKTIESNAFGSGVKELTIPATTTEIAADAINKNQIINIFGSKGSAAESFAKGLDKARFLDSEYEENGFWYQAVAGGVKVVYYDGSESPVIIPDTFKGQPVVEIGSEALTECYTKISIVGQWDVNAPNIIVGNNVKVIDSNAFCSYLRRLTITATTTEIAADAINKNQIINIFGSQGSAAESFAKGLDNARFLAWEDEQNNLWVEETEGGVKIICYDDSEEKVTIPSTIGGLPVVAIGAEAFANCNRLKEVTIPDSVTMLENSERTSGIFSNSNSLEKITIGKGVSEIPKYFAYPCTNLKEVVFEGKIKSIGHGAFIGCGSLANINLPDSLETIGPHAFWNCSNLSSVIIPDKTATVGAAAFIYCEKLTDITFGSGLTSLEPGAVSRCDSLKTVTIPEGLTTFGNYSGYGMVFSGNPVLSKVEIPKSVTSITPDSFYGSPNTIIYGIKGSYAQTYAQEYSIPFVEQGSEPGGDPTDEPGIGELTGFIGQDPEGNYFLYNKADFNNAYLAYQINPDLAAAKMYQHFINQKCAIVALRDVTKSYMDYNAAATASLLAQMKGESFDINAYFGRSDAKIYGQSVNNVANVAKDGSVTY